MAAIKRSKPATCKCEGFRRNERRLAWRRLVEVSIVPAARPRLKCLRCGWKWRAGAHRYVDSLPWHEEDKRGGLDPAAVLELLAADRLRVDTEQAIAFTCTHATRFEWRPLKPIERESNGSSYRFVTICSGNKKRKFALHRLVWIAANRAIPPDGFDVDHINGKAVANPDAIGNLRLRPASENRADKTFCSCSAGGDPVEF